MAYACSYTNIERQDQALEMRNSSAMVVSRSVLLLFWRLSVAIHSHPQWKTDDNGGSRVWDSWVGDFIRLDHFFHESHIESHLISQVPQNGSFKKNILGRAARCFLWALESSEGSLTAGGLSSSQAWVVFVMEFNRVKCEKTWKNRMDVVVFLLFFSCSYEYLCFVIDDICTCSLQ